MEENNENINNQLDDTNTPKNPYFEKIRKKNKKKTKKDLILNLDDNDENRHNR